MARRVTPAQFNAEVRRREQRRRQAMQKANQKLRRYNQAVRQHSAKVDRAVTSYNREVRANNQRQRTNRDRLRRELTTAQSAQRRRSTTTTHVTYRQSVSTLVDRWEVIDAAADTSSTNAALLDLAERETANSVAALNELDGDTDMSSSSAPDSVEQ